MENHLFKSARVVQDETNYRFIVQYKSWFSFRWTKDTEYNYHTKETGGPRLGQVLSEAEARKCAIERGESLIRKVVIWEKSNNVYI